jgi:hypothetical protein
MVNEPYFLETIVFMKNVEIMLGLQIFSARGP